MPLFVWSAHRPVNLEALGHCLCDQLTTLLTPEALAHCLCYQLTTLLTLEALGHCL